MLKSSHKLQSGNFMMGKLRGNFLGFHSTSSPLCEIVKGHNNFLVLDPTNATGGNQYDKPLL